MISVINSNSSTKSDDKLTDTYCWKTYCKVTETLQRFLHDQLQNRDRATRFECPHCNLCSPGIVVQHMYSLDCSSDAQYHCQ